MQMTTPPSIFPTRLLVVSLALAALCTAVFYTFLHEGGHALVGLLSGGRITGFSINFLDFSAHVGLDGIFSPAQQTWLHAAGAGLPFLAWLALILIAPRRADSAIQLFKTFFSLGVINSLLAWVIVPLIYLAGQAPEYDDVTKFLQVSGMPPLLLSLLAAGLYAGGMALFFTRVPVKEMVAEWRGANSPTALPWRSWIGLGGSALLVALVALLLNQLGGDGVPPGYRLAANVDLSKQAYAQARIGEFERLSAGESSFYLVFEDIDAQFLDLRLLGSDGSNTNLLQAQGFIANGSSLTPLLSLPAGKYEIRLTSQAVSGRLKLYTTP